MQMVDFLEAGKWQHKGSFLKPLSSNTKSVLCYGGWTECFKSTGGIGVIGRVLSS